METKGRLKKIGGSVALFIPPEMPEELNPGPGAEMDTEGGSIRVRRGEPPDNLIEFAYWSTKSTRRHRGTSRRDGVVRPTVENVLFPHTVAIGEFGGSGGKRHGPFLRRRGAALGIFVWPEPLSRAV